MAEQVTTALEPVLIQLIEAVQPVSLFAVGPAARQAAAAWVERSGTTLIEVDDPTQLPDQRAALTVLDATAATSERSALLRVIAQCRDYRAENLLLVVNEGEPPDGWAAADGFALGMRLVARVATAPPVLVFAFSLATYKPAPDWLNSKYWAHPERFDAQ